VPLQAQAHVESLLARHGLSGKPLAVLAPGTTWETKHWHVDGFAEVARHLLENHWEIVLTGSESERARCQAVAARCPGARDLSGQTSLSELAALIRRASLCVTNDSGTMHLAVALDIPVVSVFGPTDPIWIGPYRRPDAVVRSDVPCSPCYLRKLSRCPYGHACMQGVTAAMVIERIERILAAGRNLPVLAAS
jgi:lipopolysaccharide heptosyltransferase II